MWFLALFRRYQKFFHTKVRMETTLDIVSSTECYALQSVICRFLFEFCSFEKNVLQNWRAFWLHRLKEILYTSVIILLNDMFP